MASRTYPVLTSSKIPSYGWPRDRIPPRVHSARHGRQTHPSLPPSQNGRPIYIHGSCWSRSGTIRLRRIQTRCVAASSHWTFNGELFIWRTGNASRQFRSRANHSSRRSKLDDGGKRHCTFGKIWRSSVARRRTTGDDTDMGGTARERWRSSAIVYELQTGTTSDLYRQRCVDAIDCRRYLWIEERCENIIAAFLFACHHPTGDGFWFAQRTFRACRICS